MFSEKLLLARKKCNLTQEELAEKIGVSRQTVAKWESGESLPDIERASDLAAALGITLDELTDTKEPEEKTAAPKGRYIFGVAEVNDKGQIVIPREARRVFDIKPGTRLVVLGDEASGIALLKEESFLAFADSIRRLG